MSKISRAHRHNVIKRKRKQRERIKKLRAQYKTASESRRKTIVLLACRINPNLSEKEFSLSCQ